MLADTSLKIEAIANIIGYRFHGNFSGAFKHATGLTPNQFRKTYSPDTKTVPICGSGPAESPVPSSPISKTWKDYLGETGPGHLRTHNNKLIG